LFAASNETPEDESLGALDDRFLVRLVVPYLTSDDSMRKLFDMDGAAPATCTKISLDELRAAQAEVAALPLAADAREALIEIKHALEREGVAISDRRWRSCVRVLKAKAWLDGQTAATVDACDFLSHVLWRNPEQRKVTDRCVSAVCNPLNLVAVEREDAARELFASRPGDDDADFDARMGNVMRQVVDIHKELSKRIAAAPATKTARAKAALAQVGAWHKELAQAQLRRLSRYQISST
jgi:MoxR-like ATPase